MSGIICDVIPVKESLRRTSKKLKFPEDPFTYADNQDHWKTCGEILDEHDMDLNEMVEEIIEELD